MGLPRTLTCTVLLIRPVPAVVLPVAFPPVGDAVPILARELEVAGAVGGLRGVFWGVNRMVSHLPCTLWTQSSKDTQAPHPSPKAAHEALPEKDKAASWTHQETRAYPQTKAHLPGFHLTFSDVCLYVLLMIPEF